MVLKLQMAHQQTFKLVIMSATLQGGLFAEYFAKQGRVPQSAAAAEEMFTRPQAKTRAGVQGTRYFLGAFCVATLHSSTFHKITPLTILHPR